MQPKKPVQPVQKAVSFAKQKEARGDQVVRSRPITPDELPANASAALREYAKGSVPNEDPNTDAHSRKVIILDLPDETTVTKIPAVKKQSITGMRVLEIGDEEYRLVRKNPYGFWYVLNLEEELSSFTGFNEAQAALLKYLKDKRSEA